MESDKDKNVIVRLEVLVPYQGGHVKIHREKFTTAGNIPNIIEPPPADPTRPTAARNGQCICATGNNAFETLLSGQHQRASSVIAHVFPGNVPLYNIPDTPVTPFVGVQPTNDDPGDWNFGNTNNVEIPLPQPMQSTNTLAIWAQYSDGVQKTRAVFTAVSADRTQCHLSGYYFGSLFPVAESASAVMALRWKFTLAKVRNRECKNCGVLNRTWVVEIDAANPQRRRWLAPVPQSFADPRSHAWWRLEHCPVSGNWYLDCVQHPDMPLGSWISYVCHESAWRPDAPNRMRLNKDSGYCQVPQEITIEPA
jgi:hypothetical protein